MKYICFYFKIQVLVFAGHLPGITSISNTTFQDYFSQPACVTLLKCPPQNFTLKDCWEEELCPAPPWCRTSQRACEIPGIFGCPLIEQCPEPPAEEIQMFSFLHNYTDTWREVNASTAGYRCYIR